MIAIILLLFVIVSVFLVLTYQSGASSATFVNSIAAFLIKIFRPGLEGQEYDWALDNTQFYMRKAAHAVFFLIITALALRLFPNAVSMFVLLFFAIGSELIKLVTGNGRHPELPDMALNVLGVGLGWLFTFILH